MATKIIIRDGEVRGVYDDRLRPIYEALSGGAHLHIERTTDVEWDEESQEWAATLRSSGKVIARGLNRADVVKAEVEYLEARL